MSIFKFNDYRKYIKERLQKLPKKGRGEALKIAEHIGVHSTLVSLILNGERDLSAEQALDLAQYFQLTDIETDYFSWLVQYSRASNHRYKEFAKKKMETIRNEANKIVNRFDHEKKLTDEQKSIFYSSWLNSAIRLFSSTDDKGVTIQQIVDRFQVDRRSVVEMLNFMISIGLISNEGDQYKMGAQRTFLEFGSPHLKKHHSNWRIKAIDKMDRATEKELMFTSPVSLSKKDFEKLREELADWLKNFSQVVKDSPAEDIACLNIDFFWIDR